MSMRKCLQSRAGIATYVLAILICVAIISTCVTIAIWLTHHQNPSANSSGNKDGNSKKTTTTTTSSPKEVVWPSVPEQKKYRYASVACAERNCSKIGTQMLAAGGSAVDAMIATSLCLGVTRHTSSGIGGGGFMNFYQRSANRSYILDYRETAPAAATSTMYGEGSNISSNIGGGSIAVPGEIAGTWQAHQRFGKLPWAKLFEPSIELAENGITLNPYVAALLNRSFDSFDNKLKEVFQDPKTGKPKIAGDTVVFTDLAETYKRIAKDGVSAFYNGTLRDDIIADLQDLDGSIITSEDLRDYQVVEREPLTGRLQNGDYTMISMPPPSGGIVLQYILHILDGYNFTKDSVSPKLEDISSTSTTYHRIVEAMKFAYSMRSNLGDPAFANITEFTDNMTNPEFIEYIKSKITDDTTHNVSYYGLDIDPRVTTGTSQISVLAGNGDAASTTTSVNYVFGSKRMGKRTGILFNNLMDDFSLPHKPSWSDDAWVAPTNEANWIKPGKRPLSSMSPTVVTDKDGNVVLVTGGSGGSKIITAAASTAINNLWFGLNPTESVSRPRLHHQLLPEMILVEDGFPQEYVEELKKKNHKIGENTHLPVSDSVAIYEDMVYGVGDHRREGVSDGF